MVSALNKTYGKSIFRTIRSSLSRFLAILAIVALGVGFLAGLLSSPSDMRTSADYYYDRTRMYDARVVSTLGLTEEDLEAVRKLGVMLRIAESLDRSSSGCVKGINCDVLGDSVIMKTEVEGDASLEIRDALTANSEFRKSFRKNLEIL